MQHLLLALSIVLLTVIAGNGRQKSNTHNVIKVLKTEKVREEKHFPVKKMENEFFMCGIIIDMRGI